MADIIQIRRDTAANWTSANPTLADGEIGYEKDTGKMKIGDGSTAWTSLGYQQASGIADDVVTPAKLATQFKDTQALSGTNVDWSAGLYFTKTISADTTLTFSNLHVGVKFIGITGDYTITLPTGFTYVGGTRSASGITWIQVVCLNASTPVGTYSLHKDES